MMWLIGTEKDKKDLNLEQSIDTVELHHPVVQYKFEHWRYLYAMSRTRESLDLIESGEIKPSLSIREQEDILDQLRENENNLYEFLNVYIGKMLSGNPAPVILPGTTEVIDLLAADMSTTVAQSWWQDQKVILKWAEALQWGVSVGTTYFKQWFDQYGGNRAFDIPVNMGSEKLAEGEASIDVISPFLFFPDYTTTNPDKREWAIELYILPEYKAERFFSSKTLKMAKADGTSLSGVSTAHFGFDGKFSHGDTIESARFRSYIVREFHQKGIPGVDHGFGKGKGRVMIRAGGQTVWDGPNPLSDLEGIETGLPYTQFTVRQPADSAYGDGLVAWLIAGDETLNEMNKQIRKNFEAIGDAKLLAPDGASSNKEHMGSGGAGEVITFDPNFQPPRFMEKSPMPPNAIPYMGWVRESMQRRSGTTDMSFGGLPTGSHGMSGTAMGGLLESERVQFQKDVTLMGTVMRQQVYLALRLMQEFYDTKRKTSLAGILNGAKQYAFSGSELKLGGDIKIDVRSGFGTTRKLQKEEAIALFDRQVISPSELLEFTDFSTYTLAQKKLGSVYKAQLDLQHIITHRTVPTVTEYSDHETIMRIFTEYLSGPDSILIDMQLMLLIDQYLSLHEQAILRRQMRMQQVQQQMQSAQGGLAGGQQPSGQQPMQSQIEQQMGQSPGSGQLPESGQGVNYEQ